MIRMIHRMAPTLGVVLLLMSVAATPALADVGVVAHTNGRVFKFDPATDQITGSMSLGVSGTIGDVEISHDEELAFVSRFSSASSIYIIDLATMTLAPGTNPITSGIPVEDLSITPDGLYLVACDGGGTNPVLSYDIETRAQVDSLNLSADTNSVEVADDGSVLTTSVAQDRVRRITIDANGMFVNSGPQLNLGANPNNAYPAPGSESGVVCMRSSGQLRSFTMPGMTLVDTLNLSGTWALCAAFNADGSIVYTRTSRARVYGHRFDPATGQVGGEVFPNFAVTSKPTYYGFDQLAVAHDKIYVPQGSGVDVFDGLTGAFLSNMPTTTGGSGIKVRVPSGPGIRKIDIDIAPRNRNNPVNIDNNGWGQVVVALLSAEDFDATAIDIESILVGDAPVATRGGSGKRKAYANRDVNADGIMDLVIHVRRKVVGADRGRAIWKVTGIDGEGEPFQGSDQVTYVPNKPN